LMLAKSSDLHPPTSASRLDSTPPRPNNKQSSFSSLFGFSLLLPLLLCTNTHSFVLKVIVNNDCQLPLNGC
jgi:hypothetical protein